MSLSHLYQNVAIKEKIIELQQRGISVSVHQRYTPEEEVVFYLEQAASELIRIPEEDTSEVTQRVVEVYSKPDATIDYLKYWLNKTFPYLNAPIFMARMVNYPVHASILERTKVYRQYVKDTSVRVYEQLPYFPWKL